MIGSQSRDFYKHNYEQNLKFFYRFCRIGQTQNLFIMDIYYNKEIDQFIFNLFNNMDIRDFEGLFKFKLILPFVYIVSWIAMFIGPYFFPVIYQYFCMFFIGYLVFKCFTLLLIMIKVNIQAQKIFSKVQNGDYNRLEYSRDRQEIFFGFIIPNYKQQIQVMSQTLQFLAKQKRAKTRYLIFLAMEDHQQGSQLKAYQLIEKFKNRFRIIQFTKHRLRQFEQRGKASNVSWCAQHLQPIFEKNMINPDDVFLTIMDADSWAPEAYYQEVQQSIIDTPQQKYVTIYMAPQIFTRNNLDVPITTRVYDIMHSFAHASQLVSFFRITFPLSNYTISYNLVKRIGFWDTCPDAIGQDFHTTQKAYWKTQGEMVTKPIYVPFNQMNISTGNGYFADLKARFWQAERHAQGCADVAYNIGMFFRSSFTPKNLFMVLLVLDTCVLPAIIPWMFFSLNYQSWILNRYTKPSPQLYSDYLLSYFYNSLTILTVLSTIFIQLLKRRANWIIYNRQNDSILRVLQYPILLTFVILVFGIPTFTIAAFSVLFSKRQYIVAEKKTTLNAAIEPL